MATPKSVVLKQYTLSNQANALINLEASFLDLKSQVELHKTCRVVSRVLSPQLKAAKLLNHVLNIDEKRKKEILTILKSPDRGPLMLMRANGQVKYRSSNQGNQIVPRATYNNLSPLEAAAVCGDFHLVKLFEGALPKTQKHKAGLQLQAVLTKPNFLSAFKALQNAYHTYLDRYDALDATNDLNTIDTLWEQVGEAQKNLSNFGLNVFCSPIIHHPLPDFTQEPQRGALRVEVWEGNCWKTVDLSLDSIGVGTNLALCKGAIDAPNLWVGDNRRFGPRRVALNSAFMDLLGKVLQTELGNITERLLSYPETQEPEQDLPAGVSTDPGTVSDSSKSRCVVS